VACIGVPDDEMGEQLVALVQLVGGAHGSVGELDAWCRQSLAGYKCPKEYRFVDEIPRNAMGKLDKRALRQAFA
jgi:long-chain acyl-CoA synthetase